MRTLLFAGIGTLGTQEDEDLLDAYVKVELDRIGDLVSWHGTISPMGPILGTPEGPMHLALSDGRECAVSVKLDEKGEYTFQGIGLPPGFIHVGGETVALEGSTTPPKLVRRVAHNFFAGASAAALTSAFWVDGRAMELAGTAGVLMFVAFALLPSRHA